MLEKSRNKLATKRDRNKPKNLQSNPSRYFVTYWFLSCIRILFEVFGDIILRRSNKWVTNLLISFLNLWHDITNLTRSVNPRRVCNSKQVNRKKNYSWGFNGDNIKSHRSFRSCWVSQSDFDPYSSFGNIALLPIQNILKTDSQYVRCVEQQTSNKKYLIIAKKN